MAQPGCRHVVFCADRNYIPYAGVAAYSLLASNAQHGIELVFVADEVGSADRQRLERLSAEFKVRIEVCLLTASNLEVFARLKAKGHVSVATYYRLLVPHVVRAPSALYLDADLVVDADIRELLDAPLGSHVVGACGDLVARVLRDAPAYINSGVLLMNLERWKECQVSQRALACAAANDLPFMDQDALNAVLEREQVLPLPQKFNTTIYDRLKPELQRGLDAGLSDAGEPCVLHFTGQIKPWHAWYGGRYREKYLDYLRRSPWSDAGLLKSQPASEQQARWLRELAGRSSPTT